jgi:hypothetical protein
MPRRYAMSTIVERCQTLADLENDDHIPEAVWKSFVHMVYGELWSVVNETGHRYFETSYDVTADGSTSYDEPESHFSTIVITRVDGSNEYPLRQLRPREEAAYKGQTGTAVGWTLVDDQLWLYPTPASGTYRWYYQQQPTDLSEYADDGVVDVVTPSGEAFLIWGVVALALSKSEADVRFAISERERQRARLEFDAANRNFPEPAVRGEWIDDDNCGPPRWP